MRHPSKKDWWIVTLLAAGIVGPIVAGLARLGAAPPAPEEGWLLLAAGGALGGLIALLGWPTYYEVQPPELLIRSGVLRYRIPIAAIEAVRPSRNPLSAPAWSLDRLRIDYRRGPRTRIALVSPRDRRAFLADLARADARLRPTGDTLLRAAS